MKYVRFQIGGGIINTGILYGNHIRRVEGSLFGPVRMTFEEYDLKKIRIMPPLYPGKIVGIGANYRSFLDSTKREPPSRPKIFLKPSSSVIADGEDIICPDPSHVVSFEGELGVVIGKPCTRVPEKNAMSCVFGYTCINDLTDRTMLEEDGIWARGKGLDTFSPVGPCITDETDGMDLMIETRVNGRVMQHMSTADMYFSIPELISYISRHMTLLPGDLIATGTPAGSGCLSIGDTVEVEIQGIGALHNKMIERTDQ